MIPKAVFSIGMPVIGGLLCFLVGLSGMSGGWGFNCGILFGAATVWVAIWRERVDP